MADWASEYEAAVRFILAGTTERAREVIRCIPGNAQFLATLPRRLPVQMQCRVFFRDRFICRYCRKRVILPPVLRILSHFLGDDFKYHPHGRMTECHVAFWRDIASCDHVLPVARGGDSTSENLVTSCYMCNSIKQNWLIEELRWQLAPITDTNWDGLASLLASLLEESKIQLTPYYANWLRAQQNEEMRLKDGIR